MSYDHRAERLIGAPIEAVFRARTDLELMRRLNDHPISRASGEVRPGAAVRVEWGPSEDRLCRVTQVFDEVDPPRRLVYREVLEAPPSPVYESVITETFAERDGKTLIAFHHAGFPTEQERDVHKQGYEIILDRLERHFAKRAS